MNSVFMAAESKESQKEHRDQDKLKHSSLYREFQLEREEILKHKWIESEKAGYDIGFERALTDWIIKYRSGWRKWRQEQLKKEEMERKEKQDKNKG